MKPILLKITGLNSFEQEVCIDFETLTSKGLFGIFGPTGSGKSTIIDAMTLALYGQIPRLGDKRARHALNVNSERMAVTFVFSVGGVTYEVARAYKRNKNSIAATIARLCEQKDGETFVLADQITPLNRKIEEIIGLNYADFSRSVVLPQGKFSEFLLLAGSDRGDMLERIFNLSDYGEGMYRKVKERLMETKAELQAVEGRLADLGPASAETLEAEKARYNRETAEVEALQATLQQMHKQLSALEANAALVTEYKKARERHKQLLDAAPAMAVKRETLAGALIAAQIKPYADSAADVAKQRAQVAAAYEESRVLAEAAGEALRTAQLAFTQLTRTKDARYPELLTGESYAKQAVSLEAELSGLETERQSLLDEHGALMARVQDVEAGKEKAIREKDRLDQEMDALLKRKAEIIVSVQKRQDAARAADIAEKRDEFFIKQAVLAEKIRKLAMEVEIDGVRHAAWCSEIEQLKSDIESMGDEGKPCPLCGAIRHPDAAKKTARLNELSIKTAGTAERIAANNRQIAGWAQETAANAQTLSDYNARLKALEETLQTNDFKRLQETIRQYDMEAETFSGREEALRTALLETVSQYETHVSKLSALNAEMERLQAVGAEKRRAIDRQKSRIKELSPNLPPVACLAAVSEKIRLLLLEWEDAKQACDGVAQAHQAKNNVAAALKTRLDMLTAREKEEQDKLVQQLTVHNVITPESLLKDWMEPTAREQLQAEISTYAEEIKRVHDDTARLAAKLGGVETEKIAVQVTAMNDKIMETYKKVEQKMSDCAIMQLNIARTEENLHKMKALTEQKADLHRLTDLAADLADLLEGKKFVRFIAKRQLRYITAEAAARLKVMTSGRYALELLEDEFFIRDDYNGGVRRSPKSLSGGETFMASLCLALALSSKIQLGSSAPLEFFFLDEGFGSLDPVLLDVVISALERLHMEKMSVGIITHVEELKNRIAGKLIVTPACAGVSGSTVSLES